MTSTSSGSSQLAADESDSLKAKDSSLSQVDNPFDRLKISESQAPDDEAPASEYVANSESDWASTEDESDVEELNSELVESNTVDGADSNEEGSDEGEPEAKGSDKEASMPTFGDLKIGSKSSPFDILKTGQAAEKLEEAAKVDGMPKFAPLKEDKSIGQLLPKAESSLPKFTTDNAIRGSTDSNEPSATPKPSSPQSSTVVKPADTEEIKDHKLQDKNTQSQEDEVEEASEILSLDQEEIIEVPEIRFEPLLSFNGWTSEPAKLENQISDKIASLLARSQGEATILRQNVKIIDRLIDTSEFSAITLEEDDLEYPTRWTLGNIDRITELAKVLGAEISEKLDTLRQQDKSLSSIVELAGKCEVNQEQLGRIVSQIAVFKQEVESARLINRPLDVRAQSLCSSLRKKLRQVQEQHETALEKMVQLSLKQQANREFVDKLEQVVFEIHARAKQYNDEIASLEAQLLQMPAHESASPVTLMLESGSYSVLEAQKKRLAAKFANGTTTRKVEISPN